MVATSQQLHRRVKLLNGMIFGRLTVISIHEIKEIKGAKKRKYYYLCQCSCGKEAVVHSDLLKRGYTRSCGCLSSEQRKTGDNRRVHGLKNTPEYICWTTAKQRCFNPKNEKYPDYGKRGIKMCDRWCNSFEAFYENMGKRPSSEHSIDRIDVNGHYCPENCRWATREQQANNRRTCKNVTLGCVTLTVSQWEREMGFKCGVIKRRLLLGWEESRALTTPLRSQNRSIPACHQKI